MYVAVKGVEKAIEAAHSLQAALRRGESDQRELGTGQIEQQLGLAVDRVMTEGGVYYPELAALAIKQASDDLVEAIFCCAPIALRCRGWPIVCLLKPAKCALNAVFPPSTKISPADKCWVRLMTIATAYSISPCWPRERRPWSRGPPVHICST